MTRKERLEQFGVVCTGKEKNKNLENFFRCMTEGKEVIKYEALRNSWKKAHFHRSMIARWHWGGFRTLCPELAGLVMTLICWREYTHFPSQKWVLHWPEEIPPLWQSISINPVWWRGDTPQLFGKWKHAKTKGCFNDFHHRYGCQYFLCDSEIFK